MNFGDAVASVVNKFADFSGRARRSEYWYWILCTVFISYICSRIMSELNISGVIISLIDFAVWIMTLSVSVRRLHDIGKSGWWLLINLIPLVGQIILFVFRCRDSEGDNQYGPSPKYSGNNQY